MRQLASTMLLLALFPCLTIGVAHARGEIGPAKSSVAHDGKAFSVYQAENRERWRKQIRGRGVAKALPGFSIRR